MTNALATIPANQAIDPYTPRDLAEARTLAADYAKSKILGAYGTAEQVMLVMATGAELGIAPTAALRGLYVVEGRIFMSSDLMVALCMRAPQCERFDLVENTAEAASYIVRRRGGQDITFRFTIDDAKRAGLVKSGSTWEKYPAVRCRHRAASQAARAVFPDVIMGMYDETERDEVTVREAPAPVQPLSTPRTAGPTGPVIADAEVVESDEARIVRLLGEAQTTADLAKIAAEAGKIWPGKRPAAVSAAYAAEKKRIDAGGKVDAETGEVTREREPGEDDE